MKVLNDWVDQNTHGKTYATRANAERAVAIMELAMKGSTVLYHQRTDGRWAVVAINHPNPLTVVSMGWMACGVSLKGVA